MNGDSTASTQAIAVVGLACRYPDADDPAALLDMACTGRRAFRRIPPCRVDLADYYSANPSTPDATYSTRAALVEGWRFDRASFGISASAYHSADPAHWLALETACRALAAAGLGGGAGLPRDAAGAYIGNTLTGDVSRASALRLRWPYSRRVMADAMYAAGVPADLARRTLRVAAARYLAPFPQITAQTLAGTMPGGIATAICGQLGFRGGGRTVDAGGASSLAAVASACLALSSGELDMAVAGGVDLSLGPLDLVGMAKSGVLAANEMRVYDANPTGFLPGEGCGMVLLMRASDAKAAGLPVYAEILGWGMASAGYSTAVDQVGADAASQLLAMRQAYRMARVDPVDVQLIEGCGTGLAGSDEAELAALTALRSASPHQVAALGSICANIGNTRAAAGAAGLLKAVLSLANGVLPPSTGIVTPHPILSEGRAALWLPTAPQAWPDGVRHAAVGALGADGLSVHLVLRGPGGRRGAGTVSHPRASGTVSHPRASGTVSHPRASGTTPRPTPGGPSLTYPISAEHPATYLLQAPDRSALTAILSRVAGVAPWLSDAELHDLAAQLARDAASEHGDVKVAIVASRQEQLARLASEAITLLPGLSGGALTIRPPIFAADGADGRVTLLLADSSQACADSSGTSGSLPQQALGRALAVMRWLDELGVQAKTAVGHGVGELAGLVWAGCATPADARALTEVRASVLAAPADAAPGHLSSALDEFAGREFGAPRRRLISACTGRELADAEEIAELLSTELFDARLVATGYGGDAGSRLDRAVRAGAAGASLLLQTDQDGDLMLAAATLATVPTIGIVGGEDRTVVSATAALFVAGALPRPDALYEDWPSRSIDIWREQIFIANPCQAHPVGANAGPNDTGPNDARPNGAASSSQGAAETPDTGVAPRPRPSIEQPPEVGQPVLAGDDRPWALYTGGCDPLRGVINEIFPQDTASERTMAVLGGLGDPRAVKAAVQAAQAAIGSGELVVISAGAGPTGLWATLHAEHPSIGITVLRTPITAQGLAAAKRLAATTPGELVELEVAPDGAAREPDVDRAPLPGDFPLGAQDVVLISRGAGAAGLTLAQVLTCSGAAVAIVGPGHREHDREFVAELERLRCAGSKVGYEAVDTANRAELVAAIRRIEARLGQVTAVAHATTATPSRAVADLTAKGIGRAVAAQTAVLDQLVAAVKAVAKADKAGPARPRLIATFGSVAGRYGLAGEGTLALVTGALAGHGRQLVAGCPGCRALHVDWPGWAGAGLDDRPGLAKGAERGGLATTSIAEGSRLLRNALSTVGLPGRLAPHGGVGGGVSGGGGDWLVGRFAERVLAHYAGIEIVLQASLSACSDPYLMDYQADGVATLPPAMALEAMAQAASALAGAPVRAATEIVMAAPVVLSEAPGSSTDIRVCAQRDADLVTVVLRCESSGFTVDHCRATFACQRTVGAARASVAKVTKNSPGALRVPADPGTPRALRAPRVASALIAAGGLGHRRWSRAVHRSPADDTVEAAELYGSILAQTGRFMRLATVRLVSPRSATALVADSAEPAWFGADLEPGDAERRALLLGSPGLSDATLQVVQACVPHRRLAFAGCEFASFSRSPATGTVTIRATEAGATVRASLVPRPRIGGHNGADLPDATRRDRADSAGATGPAESVWNVEAVDSTGQLLVSWRRLRMREVGPLPHPGPWPAPLLACYLERAVAELGLGPGLQVQVSRPELTDQPPVATMPPADRPTERDGWSRALGEDNVAGLVLRVRARQAVACAWHVVRPTEPDASGWLTLIDDLARERPSLNAAFASTVDPNTAASAPSAAAIAQAAAIAACARSSAVPSDLLVGTRQLADASWLLLRTGPRTIASVITYLAGCDQPVAIAVASAVGPKGTLAPHVA